MGKSLLILSDNYMTKLPKAEHKAAEWQDAGEALILVAPQGDEVMRALNRYVERVFDPTRKQPNWRRKLQRTDDTGKRSRNTTYAVDRMSHL
jgi:hypothetical protein